jgi:hypothetical protein
VTGFFWLASYPKSGSTWLALALGSLHRGGQSVEFTGEAIGFPQAASRDVFDTALGLESSNLTPEEDERLRPRLYELLAEQASEPLIRRVHSALVNTSAGEPLLPLHLTQGAVYLVRDPRDVAISYAHYIDSTIDTTIEVMRNPEALIAAKPGTIAPLLSQRLLTWSDHVESWLSANVPLLLIRYEDMLQQPEETLVKVASFLNWNAEPAVVAAAVEATRFNRLQSEEEEHGYEFGASRRFFRSGRSGGWREALSTDQVRRIEQDHGRMMMKLGYELTA